MKYLEEKFDDGQIRSVVKKGIKWFSVQDIVSVLTNTTNPRRYWSDLKAQMSTTEGCFQLYDFTVQLKLPASDGKNYKTDCVNLEGALRLIQSIPSPKAEPFKQWLARVGYERLEEDHNPELAIRRGRERAVENYRKQGRSETWIEERVQAIETRVSLTDIIKAAGGTPKTYGMVTAVNHNGTFGLSVDEHKDLKQIKKNLRDHMVTPELSFNAFSEYVLKNQLKQSGAKTPSEIEACVRKHAATMKKAREVIEADTGMKIATPETPTRRLT